MSRPSVAIDVSTRCAGWIGILPGAERLARAAARQAIASAIAEVAIPAGRTVELGIVLTNDAEQRRLNRDWRGIDRPTNVLAFPARDPGTPAPAGAPVLLGDVVIARETVAREAVDQRRSLADHFRHLVVHGVLHLLGYDHDDEPTATAMQTLETSILASLGVADPYRRTM